MRVGSNNYVTGYSYAAGGHGANSTTDLISGITQSGFNFNYQYDAVGNIISETRGGQKTTYEYDNLNQLTRVNDPYQNKTFVYSYDLGGNLQQVSTYAYTTGTLGAVQNTCTYTYGDTNWKDKMTTFGGKAIEYDVIGNPTEYDGWTFVWQAGRQLKEMTKDSRYARFAYDHDGMRTRKQTESGRTDYYWSGKRLLELKVGDDVLHMYYDAADKPAAVSYGNSRYRYVYNLQGDVIALVDAGQAAVVEYRYDAWGKLLATTGSMAATLGKLNPFRYRGYIYDKETGLYWLRSRYYNPEWKRFLNADSVLGKKGGLLSHNLFTYCYNNPVDYVDTAGKSAVYFNVYLQPNKPFDIGHVDISIGNTTYTYGRYDSTATWGVFGMYGDGVLEVGSRQLFIDDQVNYKHRNATSFQLDMTENEVNALQQYFDNLISSATPWIPDSKERSNRVQRYKFDAGPFKTYNLFTNNCTTFALTALRTAIKDFPYTITGFVPSFVKQKFAENAYLKSWDTCIVLSVSE